MKKLEFNLYPNIIKTKGFFAIKDCKLSFISVILDAMELIKIENIFKGGSNACQTRLIFFEGERNKSRLIFYDSDKIYSIYFPFSIDKVNGELKVHYRDYEISGETISFLKSILNNFNYKCSLDEDILLNEIREEYLDYIGYENDEKSYFNNTLEIFKELLSLDTGYIRYDHDEAHAGEQHPVDHLDIFYSGNSSIKIGLKKKYGLSEFLSILYNTPSIKYIND